MSKWVDASARTIEVSYAHQLIMIIGCGTIRVIKYILTCLAGYMNMEFVSRLHSEALQLGISKNASHLEQVFPQAFVSILVELVLNSFAYFS